MCMLLVLLGVVWGDGFFGWWNLVFLLCCCFFLIGVLFCLVISCIWLLCIWGSFVLMFLDGCEFCRIFVMVIGRWFDGFNLGRWIDFLISFLKVLFVFCLVFVSEFFIVVCLELIFFELVFFVIVVNLWVILKYFFGLILKY